jgi:hypothetical protein
VNSFFPPRLLQGIQQGGSDLPHPAACGCGCAKGESVRARGAVPPEQCPRCSVPDWQPERRVIRSHFPCKGVCVGTPSAQDPPSPLLLSVESVKSCCRIRGHALGRKHSCCTLFHGKNTDGCSRDAGDLPHQCSPSSRMGPIRSIFARGNT